MGWDYFTYMSQPCFFIDEIVNFLDWELKQREKANWKAEKEMKKKLNRQ